VGFSGQHRVLVTGGNGFIGRRVVAMLAAEPWCEHLVSADLRRLPLARERAGVHYETADVRDSALADLVAAHRITTVVHLASIVTPGRESSRAFEYSVDVEGTRNVLAACVHHRVRQIVVTSSGAAYGYWPDNPAWISEEMPLRGNVTFAYSDHKRQVEEMLAEYRQRYPQLLQLILRPGTVLGSEVQNQITDLFRKPVILGVAGSSTPFVFIWDEDVGAVIVRGVRESRSGIFNLAGDGALPLKELAATLGKPYLPLPASLIRAVLRLLKPLGLSRYGPEQVDFLRYRPVLSNQRLKREFGYRPQYTSAEAWQAYLSASGQRPRR
jgi:UDP-glucose 4-epimerase